MLQKSLPIFRLKFQRSVDDGRISSSDIDIIYPINPLTNLRVNELTLLISPDTPESVRNSVSQRLVDNRQTDVGLSEEDKVRFMIPRSCQSLSEVSAYRDMLSDFINANNVAEPNTSEPAIDTTDKSNSNLSSD